MAPHLVELTQAVRAISIRKGHDPDANPAAVMCTLDRSQSTEWPERRFYTGHGLDGVPARCEIPAVRGDEQAEAIQVYERAQTQF